MHTLTFFPIGNADCCQIDLACGRKLLFDYAHYRNAEDEEDLRIDLATALREDLKAANRDYYDVVAFTHADDDHIHGASEFFYLEHAKKYQDDNRIKITELWVPAAMIIEENLEGEARILRAEARHRLKAGKGIRVFSRPDRLLAWLENEGLKLEHRKHLITDAGQLVPGFTMESEGVEFFVHSPFAVRLKDGNLVDRNECSLILQATFVYDAKVTRFMICGDTTYEILADIVNITRYYKRDERLAWDVFNIPHHCSYMALSSKRGEVKTEPFPKVKWLFEQGFERGILVSSSNRIPENYEDPQPPHPQAANYYNERASAITGDFVVTMEYPKPSSPAPVRITIDGSKATLRKTILSGSIGIISRPAPRAGGTNVY
ncbi:MAG: hypothetical protein A3G93_02100 [Nitrospinae bacterium RIFCSPLOWO2_12_FULL_45_22]|nr:MAG: hypothetical protein A3G93_02100 [Nitrospinae bacterium RIFCSPLOWO2_12_FULL_45_22]